MLVIPARHLGHGLPPDRRYGLPDGEQRRDRWQGTLAAQDALFLQLVP